MNDEARRLNLEMRKNFDALAESTAKLKQLQFECARRPNSHSWTEPRYTPIIHEGYQFQGDPEGTMGVDRQLPCWIPREEIPMWKRQCTNCGLEEETRHTRDDVRKVPVF